MSVISQMKVLQKKLVIEVFNGIVTGTKEFTVVESTNLTAYVPGDKMTQLQIAACIEHGATVVMKRKGK